LFITASAAGFLVPTRSFALICLVAFLLSFATSIFLVINSYLMHFWEERGRGGKLGFYRSLTILIGSPTSVLIGYSATKYGFDFPFSALAVLLSLAAIMLLVSLVKEKKSQ
jgi:predicted MFS family arabinose efflux permease